MTDRRVEILILMSKGMGNKEIAAKLFLSESTVKNHTTHIYTIFDTPDRTSAVVRGIEMGLVPVNITRDYSTLVDLQ